MILDKEMRKWHQVKRIKSVTSHDYSLHGTHTYPFCVLQVSWWSICWIYEGSRRVRMKRYVFVFGWALQTHDTRNYVMTKLLPNRDVPTKLPNSNTISSTYIMSSNNIYSNVLRKPQNNFLRASYAGVQKCFSRPIVGLTNQLPVRDFRPGAPLPGDSIY